MKYSYNWLKELSETQKNVDELAELLLIHSFEVEGVEDLSRGLEDVVIGEVLTKEKHPDADRLNVATVDIGREQLQIVCGAPNLLVGQKVPVALVGAMLLGHGDEPVEIKKSEIRGVISSGMICAEDELGIGTGHAGIIVLPHDAPVGEKYMTYAGMDDALIEIDILPNRGHDALSYIGMANEIRALEGRKIVYNGAVLKDISSDTSPAITIDTNKCNRYIGIMITDVDIHESPEWIKSRLRASDIQPINSVVDITNYVMLETGQPLHAFDADRITCIGVRQAKDGENLVLLDNTELKLTSEDIVITDGDIPVALAGVMGGKNSGITDTTKNIVLESASFDATSVRFTQRRYNLHTDAAYRFERSIDPNLAQLAAERAQKMYEDLCGGTTIAVTDIYPKKFTPWTVMLPIDRVTKLLGVAITSEEITTILERLGTIVTAHDDVLNVIIPTIRLDLTTPEDLIEEIGRMYGYDKIPRTPRKEIVQTPVRNEERFFERLIKDVCMQSGFDEIRGYSFYSVADAQAIGLDDENHVTLLNPMNPDQAIMRRSLAPGLLHAAKKSLSYFNDIQVCEIGRIYDPTNTALPEEKLVLGAAVVNKATDGTQFYTLKGLIEILCDRIGLSGYSFNDTFDTNTQNIPDLHPSRRAVITMENGTIIGWIGEISKRSHKYFGFKRSRAAICEINIATLLKEVQKEQFFVPLAKYPFVTRDLSMIVDARVRVADVERLIYDAGDDLIKDVDLFDLYDNEETAERSMAFHITYASQERTLTAKEVDESIMRIIATLEEQIDVEVRRA